MPNLGLSSDELVDMYRTMVRTRTLDTLAISLQRQGQLGVWASVRGQEGAQIGCAFAMADNDWAFATYREHGISLRKGVPFASLLRQYKGEWFGLFDPKEYGFAPHSIPIATHLLHAVGYAHAARLSGDDLVVFGFVGDGATSEGDFHEALNFASVLDAPVVFFVQNNGYAISTPTRIQTRAPSIAHKAIGYGMQGYQVDGNDVLASYNIDKFKEFVFESSFLKRYQVDDATVEKIKTDEIELLQFGMRWLKWLLFKEGDFEIKQDENN